MLSDRGATPLLVPGAWEAALKLVCTGWQERSTSFPSSSDRRIDGRTRLWLSGPVPLWLGDISYGVFAIHMLVLNMVFLALDLKVFTGRFLVVLVLTLGITDFSPGLSFRFFESPILRLKNIGPFRRLEPAGIDLGSTASEGEEGRAGSHPDRA